NHLDIAAREALERSLDEFEGTIIVVSHDRYLLNRIVRRLVVLGPDKTRIILGNYDRYQAMLAETTDAHAPDAQPATASLDRPIKARANRKRKFPYRKASDLEHEIAEHEETIGGIELRLADPSLYRNGDEARAVRAHYEELKARLAELYEHWEEAVQ